MIRRHTRPTRLAALALGVAGALGCAATASATPIQMPTIAKELSLKKAAAAAGVNFQAGAAAGITLPAPPPCPENGIVNSVLSQVEGAAGQSLGLPTGNCGVSQPVATTLPWPGNMTYYGGHVQTHPKEYLVLWGWGAQGAFPGRVCQPEAISEPLADGTSTTQTLGCDPDGTGKYMADFLAQMGGTQWAGSQTQYYETDANGNQVHISNDKDVLAGIWIDDGNNPNLTGTNMSNPAGPTNTFTDLAAEASRAAAHFGIPDSQLIDSNIIIAQPAGFSDPNAQALGYCAFHDYTESDASGNWYYKDPSVKQGILGKSTALAYTNMPYVLNNGSICGADAVNSKADGGDIDGFSIVLGHEVEETITDPGGEATVGDVRNTSQSTATTGGATYFGAWYDATDPNENGDKCAWVGQITGTIPGSPGDIVGNAGERFAVQSLWSNSAAQGTGYCAGVSSTDLPSQVGDGEQPPPDGGTQFKQTSKYQPPAPGCNATHVFLDPAGDAHTPFIPNPANPLSGSQDDQLDLTQGDVAVGSSTLNITLTIANLSKATSLPTNLNEYQVSWSQGSKSYYALVKVDGQGNVTATDSTLDAAGNTLPASAVKFNPGKNGTIEVDVPLTDVGNPKAGSSLTGITAQTLDVVNGDTPAFTYEPGFYVDAAGNETPYIVGGSPCVAPSAPSSAATQGAGAPASAGQSQAQTQQGTSGQQSRSAATQRRTAATRGQARKPAKKGKRVARHTTRHKARHTTRHKAHKVARSRHGARRHR